MFGRDKSLLRGILEVRAELPEDAKRSLIRDTERAMERAGREGGEKLTKELADAHKDTGRLRDERGRFVKKSEDMGEEAGRRAGTRMGSMLNSGLMAAGSAIAGRQIIGGMWEMGMAAASLGESIGKAGTVFGSSASEIEAWTENSLDSMGLAQSTALKVANEFGAQLSTLSEEQRVAMAQELTQMARDLGSNAELPFEEAAAKISGAMAGEGDALRRFGANISEARVQAYALQNGLVDISVDMGRVASAEAKVIRETEKLHEMQMNGAASAEELSIQTRLVEDAENDLNEATGGAAAAMTEEQKLMARHALVMEDLNYAVGDYQRTQDSVANTAFTAKENFQSLREEFGENLLPVMGELLTKANSFLGWLQDLPEGVQNTGLAVAALAPFIIGGAAVINTLATAWGNVTRSAVVATAAQRTAAAAAVPGGVPAAAGRGALGGVARFLGPAALAYAGTAALANSGYSQMMSETDFIDNVVATPYVGDLFAGIGGVAATLVGLSSGGTVHPDGRIVRLAEGGEPEDVVPHSARMDYAASVMGASAGSNITINIYGSTDPKAAAREVSAALTRLDRQSAARHTRPRSAAR